MIARTLNLLMMVIVSSITLKNGFEVRYKYLRLNTVLN